MSAQTAPSPPRVLSSPQCQRCAGATVVQRITPSRPGHEHWTLRCKKCGHVDQMQVVTGPSLSDGSDWFERNLRSPNVTPKKRNRTRAVFLTSDQLEEQADATVTEAMQLPEGAMREIALRRAAQLRVYATMKRALTPQHAKSK